MISMINIHLTHLIIAGRSIEQWNRHRICRIFMRIAFLKHSIIFLLENLVHSLISDINKSDLLLAVPLYNLLPINIKNP